MSDKIKRKLQMSILQTEFHVPTDRVLAELLDPDQVQADDEFTFVHNGEQGLIIVRKRTSTRNFDSDGAELGSDKVDNTIETAVTSDISVEP